MLSLAFALITDQDVICMADDTRNPLHDLLHSPLKVFCGRADAKGKALETEPPEWSDECSEELGFLREGNLPIRAGGIEFRWLSH